MGRKAVIVKAIALVCTVYAVGEHSCPTVIFEEEFKTVKECNTWLTRKRVFQMPPNQKIVMGDCVVTRKEKL